MSRRSRPVVAFFVLLGMTELAKGLVFGTVMAAIPLAGFVAWNFRVVSPRRYVWLWGWLLALAIGLAWPIAAYERYPDALDVWAFDIVGRLNRGYLAQPAWYYFGTWFWVVLPWPVAGVLGLWRSIRPAWVERDLGLRFVLCWAILPPLVFSLPQGKHHHYMLHFLAPWAILAAFGTRWLWQQAQDWPTLVRQPLAIPLVFGIAGDIAIVLLRAKILGPDGIVPALLVACPLFLVAIWAAAWHRRFIVAVASSFGLLFLLNVVAFTYKSAYLHRSNDDTAFLRAVRATVPPDAPLLVTGDREALEGLRVLYYCDERTVLLHNLSFLRDSRITAPVVYLAARARDLPWIEDYGRPEPLLQSKESRREESRLDRWTLYRLYLDPALERKSGDVRISPMQAMYRAAGPRLDD